MTETHWHKEGLEEFRRGLSFPRREDDARKIARLFDEAAKSPLMKEALDWAKVHDIDFIVDRDMPMSGAYHEGTGIMGISDEMLKPENREEAMVTLVHEIRHAWQDWNGLLAPPKADEPFITSYMRQTLLEADADAFGQLAFRQVDLSNRIARLEQRRALGNDVDSQGIEALKQELQATVDHPAAPLWQAFRSWYGTKKPAAYGVLGLIEAAKKEGLDVLVRKIMREPVMAEALHKPEFSAALEPKPNPAAPGLAIGSRADLSPLGRGFAGAGNYFDAAPAGAIEKDVLSTAAAEALYIPGGSKNWLYEEFQRETAIARLSKHQAEQSARDRAIRDQRELAEREAREKKLASLREERKKNRTMRKSLSW